MRPQPLRIALPFFLLCACSRLSPLERASAQIDAHPAVPGAHSESARPTSPAPAGDQTGLRQSSGPPPSLAQTSAAADPTGGNRYVSRTPGPADGMIILYPKVLPRGTEENGRSTHRMVQRRAVELSRRIAPEKRLETRPEPEQVCPQAGCAATSVGVVFTKHEDGCAAVAVVTPPGAAESTLVPWAGVVELSRSKVPFGSSPEEDIIVHSYINCERMTDAMLVNDAAVEAAIRAAMP